MKRLNRKGFTLIELMAVIAILVIIMGIALPNITSSIERSKQKQKEAKIELLKSEAELYFDRHLGDPTVSKTTGVSVYLLISEQEIPGITTEDVCEDDRCCIKYYNNNYILEEDGHNCP